jgi:hypothetical protein
MMILACILAISVMGVELPRLGASESDLVKAGLLNQHFDSTGTREFAKVVRSKTAGKVRLAAVTTNETVTMVSLTCLGARPCPMVAPSSKLGRCRAMGRRRWMCSEDAMELDVHSCGTNAYIVTSPNADFSREACAALGHGRKH